MIDDRDRLAALLQTLAERADARGCEQSSSATTSKAGSGSSPRAANFVLQEGEIFADRIGVHDDRRPLMRAVTRAEQRDLPPGNHRRDSRDR
jgi:hypothetical protein